VLTRPVRQALARLQRERHERRAHVQVRARPASMLAVTRVLVPQHAVRCVLAPMFAARPKLERWRLRPDGPAAVQLDVATASTDAQRPDRMARRLLPRPCPDGKRAYAARSW
jgi:hypothetical protein